MSALLSISVDGLAQSESALRDAGNVAVQLAGKDNADETRVYIVQLRSPSAAERQASMAMPRMKFDKTSASAKAWVADIEAEQERVLAKAGPGVKQIYSYRFGLNGFAARMSVAQAQKLEHLSEVLHVWEDEVRPLATNYSPTFLDLFDADAGLRSVEGLDGDGVVIGVIDSGVAPEHPALQDTREADRPRACQSSWAETTILGNWLCRRYKKLPDVVAFEPPEGWNGECIINGALETGPIDADEIRSPRDADGHGTHTATTAAGNRTSASLFGTLVGDVEGIAPKARIAVYKACWLRPGTTRASCNTSDLANAIDAAVADGVDVISYSVGSSLARTTAPDDLALLAAAKAGVVAVVAAGNEGPNLGTIGSPAGGPWVITAAASTRDGESNVEAMEITAPPRIAGKYAVKEASFTPPLQDVDPIEASLVAVDDGDTSLDTGETGTEADGCQPLLNGDEVSGNIALLQRTGCRFDEMIRNAADAGHRR
jgi:subtilisin family serine protease